MKLLLIVTLLLLIGLPATATPRAAVATYSLEDFESWLPKIHRGRSEVQGTVEAENVTVNSGRRAARLNWDLTGTHDSKNNFVRFDFNRRLLGIPVTIHARVHAEKNQVGLPLRAWINDVSGETYIVTHQIEKAGWSEVVFSLEGASPAWASGDKNRRLDPPLRLLGVAVEAQGSVGTLVMDDVTVKATGQPRDFIGMELVPDQRQAIGWGTSPTFRFVVTNAANREQKDLVALFSIIDAATGEQIGEERLQVGGVKGSSQQTVPFTPALQRGVYDLRWHLWDGQGQLPGSGGTLRVARMLADASSLPRGEKERAYVRHWSLLGGIFWRATHDLDRVAKTGGVWERFGNTSQWKMLEREPGRIDLSLAVSEVERLDHAGMDLVYFNTVYNQPAFYQINQERFAPAYGRLHTEQAQAFGDKVGVYELGNEDNGPTKFLYTEIARHGAAGVRSRNADALIANSGTAQIDIGWLRMQAARGLFDRLDALITHPYSWSSPPETYGTLTQLEQVNGVIDDLGGMKIQLTTEWGYPHAFDQLKRAQWAPRHMAIAAAVGMWRHGLYSFDNHFGIYDNGRPFPMAATLNAHVALTHAHRFAGWFERNNSVWAAVYEKAGQPILMAWSPSGKASLRVPVDTGSVQLRDMYGNVLPLPATRGSALELELTGSPVYVLGAGSDVVRAGYSESDDQARQRYRRLLEASPLKGRSDWSAPLSAEPGAATVNALRRGLEEWNPAGGISLSEQALIAQALRWLSQLEHGRAALLPKGGTGRLETSPRFDHWNRHLRQSVSEDLDQPSLRWVLLQWRQLRDELAMLAEWGEIGKARHLSGLESVYDRVSGVLTEKGEKVFFPLWAYAFSPSASSGTRHDTPQWGGSGSASPTEPRLMEQFQFVPGRPVPVKIRLHSYSQRAYDTTVRLDLPSGWTSTPAEWRGRVTPGSPQETIFQVTAGDGTANRFTTVLSVPGRPPVRISFDDFEILPPVEVSVPVLARTIPEAPLPLRVANHGAESVSAELRILEGSGLPSLARAELLNLKPGEIREIEVPLPANREAPVFHAWHLIAEVKTGVGRTFRLPLTLDYELSTRAESPPPLNGGLAGWEAAMPLHLNKEEYTRGSFGATWSPEDLSGVVYTMWDDTHFYIAARVTDQLFNQELDGANTWNQDSIQFILASEDGPMNPFALALTPAGPQVWNQRTGRLARARLQVKLNPGETVYEAAIPWSEFAGIRPAAGTALRFDVLFNDDDAIINRRFMERYGIAIAHHRKIDLLGWLRLSDTGTQAVQNSGPTGTTADASAVFQEDFEEYAADTIPDRWQATSHLQPIPQSKVRDMAGRQGSRALVLENEAGRRPHVFLNVVRPLERLEPDRRYRLNVWVKGGGADANTARLIGICSDRYGNEGYSYVGAWKPTEEWQQITLLFKGPGGRLNLIIRNDRELTELRIDDITVEAVD